MSSAIFFNHKDILKYLNYIKNLKNVYKTVNETIKTGRIFPFGCEKIKSLKNNNDVYVSYVNSLPEHSLIPGISTIYLNIKNIEEIPISDNIYNFIFTLPFKALEDDNIEEKLLLNLIKCESGLEIGTKHMSLLSHLNKISPDDIVIATGEIKIEVQRDTCPLIINMFFNDRSSVGSSIIVSAANSEEFYNEIYQNFKIINDFTQEIDLDRVKNIPYLHNFFSEINIKKYIEEQYNKRVSKLNFFTVYAIPAMFTSLMKNKNTKQPIIGINLQYVNEDNLLSGIPKFPSNEKWNDICTTDLKKNFIAYKNEDDCDKEKDGQLFCDL